MTEKEELRIEALRLLRCETKKDCLDVIEIYLNFLFTIIRDHQIDEVDSLAKAEARIINQMIFTKIAQLRETVKGIEYEYQGSSLKNIIDPTIVASNTRNIYETVALFNLIFVNTKSSDEQKILYNLWVHSGLKYRQKFENIAISNESKEKIENEKKEIEALIKEIENTDLYKSLDERNKGKINTKLKEKDYKINFNGNKVEFLNWQDLTKTLDLKINTLDNIYNFFSLYTHPTNVAVFQFTEMFKNEDKAWIEHSNLNLKIAIMLTGIFIADYISLFPKVKVSFENLSIREQIAIDWQNVFSRGDEYKINDCLERIR
jgi:hypothetical protein